jgi:vanillate O-demethylase monooxygenase subunit
MALSAPTPETADTTHYFFGFVRNFGLNDPQKERILSEGMVKVFNEDIPILEAQQRNWNASGPEINIAVDAAPMAARRMLEAMMARESATG